MAMGKHYVPQQHLRRFGIENKPGLIWMYDKVLKRFKELPIKIVAQDAHYYPDDVEKELAQNIEAPGNAIISKIMNNEWISDADRLQLSLYLMTMTSRGPRARRKSFEKMPGIVKEVLNDYEKELHQLIAQTSPDNPMIEYRLKELEWLKQKMLVDGYLPEQTIRQLHSPFWSPKTVACIYNMRWHVMHATGGHYFVTCDTPAFYFEGLGLSKCTSEYTFPLSKTMALICNNQGDKGIVTVKTRTQFIKEVNRRILSHAERFAFSPFKETWIETVIEKTDPYLSSIIWQ